MQNVVERWKPSWKTYLILFLTLRKPKLCGRSFAGLDFSGDTPNHVLALAYAKAVAGRNIKLHRIRRQGAGYHSVDKDVDFASATALRQHQSDQDFLERFMPSVAIS